MKQMMFGMQQKKIMSEKSFIAEYEQYYIQNSIAATTTYSFDVLNWTITEIKELYVKVRNLMTHYRMHHPKADIDCLYITKIDGRWLNATLKHLLLAYKNLRKANLCT